MADRGSINRRNVLRSSTAAGLGALCLSGSAGANVEKTNEFEDDFDAENYVETEEYIYRRVQTSETKMLLRFDLEKGEATFAEIESTEIQSDKSGFVSVVDSSEDVKLREQTRSMTGVESVTAESADSSLKAVNPVEIAKATEGIEIRLSGVIFERVDVATEYIGSCGTIGYDDHNYYHVAMELGDYDFDDLGDVIAFAVVCDALFILVGSKSKVVKKLLKKIADTPLIRGIPDSICGFIFGKVLDGIFSGGDGTFAFWDRESGKWVSTSKLAFGGSNKYDPDPEEIRDRGPEEEFTGVHTEALQ